MTSVEKEFQKALKEIGEIKPWWSEADGLYIFEHPAYPLVDYAASTPEEVIQKYKVVLKDFIQERLTGNIADSVERITSGRGGLRPGAGRPKGEIATTAVRIPEDVANWLKSDPSNIDQVRRLMG